MKLFFQKLEKSHIVTDGNQTILKYAPKSTQEVSKTVDDILRPFDTPAIRERLDAWSTNCESWITGAGRSLRGRILRACETLGLQARSCHAARVGVCAWMAAERKAWGR